MSRRDDCTVDPETLREIQKHADRLLREGGAYGRFPTPIADIIGAANLAVEHEASLDDGFLRRIYKSGREKFAKVQRALSKVWGLLDIGDRRIYIDRTVHEKKQVFLELHETGHYYLPWQRETYAYLEDCEQTLQPDVKEDFERQANVFASEVLFQGEQFDEQAGSRQFGVKAAIDLSKLYGGSVYATFRRYVSKSPRVCALLVLEPPVWIANRGYCAQLRRSEVSRPFHLRFGVVKWAPEYDKEGFLAAALFPHRRVVKPTRCTFRIGNGQETFYYEAFNSSFGLFILLYPESAPQAGRAA